MILFFEEVLALIARHREKQVFYTHIRDNCETKTQQKRGLAYDK